MVADFLYMYFLAGLPLTFPLSLQINHVSFEIKGLLLGLPRYTRIVAAPQISAMRIVFEYTHLYIRIQTNIHKNEKPYLFGVLECLHFTLWALDYLRQLITVELGDRSCPSKVKRRSCFQILRADLSK